MNKKELKELIKPLVKECVEESVREVVLGSGLLSSVISEVVKGITPMLTETKQSVAPTVQSVQKEESAQQSRYAQVLQQSEKKKMTESRKQLLDSIGKTSYNGVNVFEGVTETIPDEPVSAGPANPMSGIAPGDAGVDITSLFDFNKANLLAKGKKRSV